MRQTATLSVLLLVMLTAAPGPASAQDRDLTIGVTDDNEGADVLGAFMDSLKLLLIEHGTRVAFEAKTRAELGGHFWTDYRRSVRVPRQWDDSDPWVINYVGHPIHGAAAGYIWLDHEPGAPPDITLSGKYWASRARAMAW